jgi:hypothetical protein
VLNVLASHEGAVVRMRRRSGCPVGVSIER